MKRLLVFFLLIQAVNIFSWTLKTHTDIGEIIYLSLPPQYQNLIDKSEFLSGCVAPDKKEYKSVFKWLHVYHPETSYGDAPQGCEELYKKSLSLFKLEKKKQASFLLGGLVHYIVDLCMPLHTAESYWETDAFHNEVEKEAEDITLTGYQPKYNSFNNVFSFAVSCAKSSFRNYDVMRDKQRRYDILKQQLYFACDSGYSVVFDIMKQVMPLTLPSTSAVSVVSTSPVVSSVMSADYVAEVPKEISVSQSVNPSISGIEVSKTAKKELPISTPKPNQVRVMGIFLNPDKEYRLKLVPDGSGNFYLDIWEVKE